MHGKKGSFLATAGRLKVSRPKSDKRGVMANIVGLVTAQMKSVCDGLGAGIKSLLMDSETISTISIACPQSALMRQAPHYRLLPLCPTYSSGLYKVVFLLLG